MKISTAGLLLTPALSLVSPTMHSIAQTTTSVVQQARATSSTLSSTSPSGFDAAADTALTAMQKQANELGIQGVAVISYAKGPSVTSWSSKMVVVGHLRVEPTATDKGSNLLAIAYAKAAEMADTLKDSGSQVRSPLTGELGWTGGVISSTSDGYVIAAFSGGKSEDDVKVSHTGLDAFKAKP